MSVYAGPEIVNDGLVLCLDAANVKSYPGSGTTWTDLSGNGNHFTLYNSPTYSTNNLGMFTFDGTNQYCRSINNIDLSSTNAVTIFYMMKVNFYPNTGSTYIIHEFSDNLNYVTDGFVASYNDVSVGQNYQVLASVRGNSGYNIASYDKTCLNTLAWRSHCVVHDKSQTSTENLIYSNGVQPTVIQNPVSGVASNNTNNFANRLFYIACRGGNSLFALMSVGLVIMYNRALTAAEIQQNFNATRGRFGI